MKIKVDRQSGLPVLPECVIIGGKVFQVIYPYTFSETSDHQGQMLWDQEEIRIGVVDRCGNTVSPSNVISTFVHEILHILEFFSGQYIFHETTQDCNQDREKENDVLIDAWTEAIVALLVQNGWVEFS